jgi:drug/metabolite transporter (DMT)-like permease
MTRRASGRPWEVHAALAGAQVGFSLFPILGKLVLAGMPPLLFAAFRAATAASLLEAFRRARERPEPVRRGDVPRLVLYGLLGVSFNQILFIEGLSRTTAINTTVLTATIPIFTLAAAVLLKHERFSARAALGIALASAGALAILDAQRFDWSSASFRGDLLLIANCISYSLYLVLSRPVLARYDFVTFTASVFRYGAVLIVLLALPELRRFRPGSVSATGWLSLAGVILLCTVIPYLLNAWALARTHASHVAFYVFLQPVVATALAIPILGETLTAKTALAALLIFAGLAAAVARVRLSPRPVP